MTFLDILYIFIHQRRISTEYYQCRLCGTPIAFHFLYSHNNKLCTEGVKDKISYQYITKHIRAQKDKLLGTNKHHYGQAQILCTNKDKHTIIISHKA